MLDCPPCLLMDNIEKTFRVLSFGLLPNRRRPRAQSTLFRGLEISDDGHSDRVFLMFPDFAGEDLYGFPLLCWAGVRIAAFNLQRTIGSTMEASFTLSRRTVIWCWNLFAW